MFYIACCQQQEFTAGYEAATLQYKKKKNFRVREELDA